MASIADLRRDYGGGELTEAEAGMDPFALFHQWLERAVEAGLPDPNAFTLATATPTGRPSARIVLLKALDERGFTFFTNYESRKGRELTANPFAAAVFWWHDFARQVRIEGPIERVSAAESDEYFASRPLGSRLGAWASPQSEVIPSRADLEHRHAELMAKYPDGAIPRPPQWGGFRLVPEVIEFWQGRLNRLHDRLRYRRVESGWVRDRLAP